jgi:predicted dehydrogenase
MSALRVAVTGLGYWGPNLVRNLHEIEDVEVAWICDRRPEALEKIGRRYPAVGRTTSYETVLGDDSVDAVVIATPVSTHHPLASAALRAGKHVFIEKPLAASTEEARDLIELADERGLVVMPGHTFLYSPPVNMIRDLIETGELGDVYFISTSRVNLGLHQPDVSVAWDLGPHDFSILRYWLQETPNLVSAVSRGCILPNTPDVAFIDLEFASGPLAHVELSWLAPSKLRRTTIVGSRKMVVYDDTSNEPVRIFDSGVMLPDPHDRLAAPGAGRAAAARAPRFLHVDHGRHGAALLGSPRAGGRADDRGGRFLTRGRGPQGASQLCRGGCDRVTMSASATKALPIRAVLC